MTMTSPNSTRWMLLVAANALVVGVLVFNSTSGAAPQSGQPPFNNSVEQRESQLRELREIKELLKEQNALLKAGADKLNAAAQRSHDQPWTTPRLPRPVADRTLDHAGDHQHSGRDAHSAAGRAGA